MQAIHTRDINDQTYKKTGWLQNQQPAGHSCT
jgi:hypothetical protein